MHSQHLDNYRDTILDARKDIADVNSNLKDMDHDGNYDDKKAKPDAVDCIDKGLTHLIQATENKHSFNTGERLKKAIEKFAEASEKLLEGGDETRTIANVVADSTKTLIRCGEEAEELTDFMQGEGRKELPKIYR